MGQTARFQETLRRLAMIDEGVVEDEARLGLDPALSSALDPKTVALLRVGASVAIGSPAVCLEWSAGRALAAGASEDEIADVLLAVVPVVGLGRVVSAAPDLAIALGYDVAAALELSGGFHPAWDRTGKHAEVTAPGAGIQLRPRFRLRLGP